MWRRSRSLIASKSIPPNGGKCLGPRPKCGPLGESGQAGSALVFGPPFDAETGVGVEALRAVVRAEPDRLAVMAAVGRGVRGADLHPAHRVDPIALPAAE